MSDDQTVTGSGLREIRTLFPVYHRKTRTKSLNATLPTFYAEPVRAYRSAVHAKSLGSPLLRANLAGRPHTFINRNLQLPHSHVNYKAVLNLFKTAYNLNHYAFHQRIDKHSPFYRQ